MTDPTIQRATCAAVLDVLARTPSSPERSALWERAKGHAAPSLAEYPLPETPPSAVDAVLSWCARELDRVGVP